MDNKTGYYKKAYIRTEFPEKIYSTDNFGKTANKILSSLLELTSSSILNEQLQNEINQGIDQIQVKTYYDEIERMLNNELDLEKDMHMKYVDTAILERLKNLSPTRVTRNRLSRIPGKIVRIPSGLVSLQEMEQKRRKEISWNSYYLTRLCRSTRLRRQFVSVNSIVLPHYQSRKRFFDSISNDTEKERVKEGTTIVTVSFYHQIRGMKISEFDILDTQTLSDLRDSFICHDSKQEEELLGFHPSGDCFEINGDLYLDGSDDIKSSFVNTLRDFTSKPNPGTFEMKSTKISHLKIPINSHSSYIHSGDCEHRVTFTNIRLFNPNYDSPYKDAYPIQIYSHSRTITFCEICGVNQVSKVIFNSVNLPRNPSQLCDSCTFAFLYDKNTKQTIEKCIIRSINNR
ncbi:uncharacterized protein cubi_02779 [Cryptosporidium ubiquitum]|uniref:snRNA-activating protein complex subunit 3 n=1 Tax=Cryptosporidium ubiquitum TaxID=857276 RepID=A0A1J4MIC6_9CRYT|nr:uncharacterized protein cubi_02779 [Cryptosporidium ubiquitum]OII73977.1 hypothetical protein cubi_02779 [Cryptosporidium ubiquitum]